MNTGTTATAGKAMEVRNAQVKHAGQLIGSYQTQFARVVPAHIDPEAFVELAIAYVKRDRDLLAAAQLNPQSLIQVLRECAALGHLPMKGIFSLVAFNDKNAQGGKSVVGMEEWRGVVERMFRAGGVESVHVEVGRENDRVLRFNRTRDALPLHEYDEFASPAERGPLKVVYAWARLRAGGTSQVAWLPRYEVLRHRSMSRTATKVGGTGGSFWGPEEGEGPNTEAMWRKTALHVLEGFVPTSAAYRWEVAAAESKAQGWSGVPDRSVMQPYGGAGDVLDGELADDAGNADGWPPVSQPPAVKGAGDAQSQ